MSVLAENGDSFTLPVSAEPFLVGAMFSAMNPEISLHAPPPLFLKIFGGLEIEGRTAPLVVRQCAVTRSASVKRVRMEFDCPCHLDCRALYDLMVVHRRQGEVQGGLSVGDASLPYSNAIFLLDWLDKDTCKEHPISLRYEKSRWRIHMEKEGAGINRFSEHDKVIVPNSSMQFRRKFFLS